MTTKLRSRSAPIELLRRHPLPPASRETKPPGVASSVWVEPLRRPEGWKDPERLRADRAAHRLRQHWDAALKAKQLDLTFLEINTVKQNTAAQYQRFLNEFKDWCHKNHVGVTTADELDLAVVEWLEHIYFPSSEEM